MTLHIGHRHTEQQNEIREARKILKERVRDDWYWPVLPAHTQADSARKTARSRRQHSTTEGTKAEQGRSIGGFKFHNTSATTNGGDLYFEPVEWRERTYSSADSDTDLITDVKKKFRFEAPDSVGKQLSERTTARNRRRQKALAEEMQWNDGLAHWWSRRDAWCCAVPSNTTTPSSPAPETSGSNSETETETITTTNSSSSPRSSTSTTATSLSSTSLLTTTTPPPPTTEMLIPLAPPILPNHPIRSKISPTMYSEIYTKIILQSRTPSVPINLATLIAALIKGWKDDGEWPPKGTVVPEMAVARKKEKDNKKEKENQKESPLKSGVKAFGRVLRLGG